MNVRAITKALHTLSLLSDEDYDLVLKLRALTEDERGMLMLVLEPSKPAGKKASKKSSKSPSSKSPRATGIEQQLSKRREQGRAGTTIDVAGESEEPDIFDAVAELRTQVCTTCGGYEDFMDHHQPSPHYHPFRPAAPIAPTRSPANGGTGSSTQNSEASAVSVGAATGGSNE